MLSTQDPLKLNCPTCRKEILWTDDFPFRPFCSDRCRLIDLGEWANENHRIAGDSLDKLSQDDSDES